VIDYSDTAVGNMSESSLIELDGMGATKYFARWYAPPTLFDLSSLGITPAKRHCDGTPKNAATDPNPSMIRVDGVAGVPIDWNHDGDTADTVLSQDLNFSGGIDPIAPDGPFAGFNDWNAIDLRQIGGRRNAHRFSLDIWKDDLSAGDAGLGDAGLGSSSGDAGLGDAGLGDAGLGDAGLGDAGLGDAGLGDAGLGDAGLGDAGLGDAGLGGDLDYTSATAVTNPPSKLTAALSGSDIQLNWKAPNAGKIVQYKVFRTIGPVTPKNLPAQIGTPPGTSFLDTKANKPATYYYFVEAVDNTGSVSNPSNTVSITK
jgi:hypothetical protein